VLLVVIKREGQARVEKIGKAGSSLSVFDSLAAWALAML
jgi:hypothetical protein